jgi:phage-related protein
LIRKIDEYNGGTGSTARIMLIATDDLTRAPEVEEMVYVMGAKIAGYTVEFRLGARNPLGINFPARMQWKDRCAWQYKGAECGYTGALPTCDFSLQGDNGCAAHNNTRRFGGFPGIRNRS